jgi:uncharacterized membrane protein
MSPIHPAIVHFPVGLTLSSVAADTVARIMGWNSLADAGAWSLLGAAMGATLAVAAGHYDMKHDTLNEQTHHLVHLHLRLGWVILLGLWALVTWRWIAMDSGAFATVGYLIVAWIVVALVLFQGWFGGEMVYGHGAGVAPAEQGQESASAAAGRALWVYRLIMRRPASQDHRR